MKSEFAVVLAVLGFCAILLLSCADAGESSFSAESSSSGSSSSVATYTVIYYDVAVPTNQTKIHDVLLTLSDAVPTREGYAFANWNTEYDGTGMSYASGASYTDNADITLYAQWTANTYTVTYNAGTDVIGVTLPDNQTKIHDVELTLSSAVPTRIGYAFDSWNTLSNGTGKSYYPESYYADNANITLYAQWTVNTYTVIYKDNWGINALGNQTKIHDVALKLSSVVPTITGYTFAGWNTSANGTGTSYAPGASYTANADITLYDQWMPTYTIEYNANNGSDAPGNQTKIYNVALTLNTAVPTRNGYSFAGWNTSANGSGTSYVPGASYIANANVTLYAQWNTPVVSNCDGQVFQTVEIGTQIWMAENLNCNVSGSKCYGNSEYYCDKYGRLYDWATAMALPSSCNSSFCASQIKTNHQGICPAGWHIPSDAEWTELIDYAGGSSTAGTKLKATSGWNGNGTDNGFSALPGGYGYSDGSFDNAGNYGYWWSASEYGSSNAYRRTMNYNYEYALYYNNRDKSYLFSVRCLQD